ncbi:hypothetical protein JW835_14410, partial [bacterium]|nr:hypothetical protein [bacterium]
MQYNRKFLILFLILDISIFAQDFNPPYPRIGGFTFTTGVNETMEAHVDILKDFDIICFPSSSNAALAHKALRPDRPILATSGCFWAYQNSETPEEWFYHKADGGLIPLFNDYYLMNLTTLCPYVDLGDGHGPKQFIDHCLDLLPEDIDFTIFDGVFFDWSWTDP